MADTAKSQSTPSLFYCVALLALGIELTGLYWISQQVALLQVFGLHITASAIVGLWTFVNRRKSNGQHFSSFLLPLTLAAGPFGIIICLIASLTHALSAPYAMSPSEWIESMFEREPDSESVRLFERITQRMDDFEDAEKVEPFRDILIGGTILQKQMAAAKIARYFRPQFAPLLLQAANDPNAAVRVQAATALAKIERDVMTRYIRLENALKSLDNDDPAKLKLAEFYDDYAFSGLLDDTYRQNLRDKAIVIYKACLATTNDPDCRLRLGRLYLRQNQNEAARDCLMPLVNASADARTARYWYMEALFRLHQYDELRALAENDGNPGHEGSLTFEEIASLTKVWQADAEQEVRHAS